MPTPKRSARTRPIQPTADRGRLAEAFGRLVLQQTGPAASSSSLNPVYSLQEARRNIQFSSDAKPILPTPSRGSVPAAPTVPVTSQELTNQSDVIRDANMRGLQQQIANFKHAADNTYSKRLYKYFMKKLKLALSNKKDIVIFVSLTTILFQNPKARELLSWLIDVIFNRGLYGGYIYLKSIRQKWRVTDKAITKNVATAALVTGQVATIGASFNRITPATASAAIEPTMAPQQQPVQQTFSNISDVQQTPPVTSNAQRLDSVREETPNSVLWSPAAVQPAALASAPHVPHAFPVTPPASQHRFHSVNHLPSQEHIIAPGSHTHPEPKPPNREPTTTTGGAFIFVLIVATLISFVECQRSFGHVWTYTCGGHMYARPVRADTYGCIPSPQVSFARCSRRCGILGC